MVASTSMSSATAAFTSQPDEVADKVLRRAELGKMARRLQNRLALAQFKTRHGWEDLTLDMIEPKVEDEIRRKRSDGDMLSDSSSSTSDHPYSAGGRMLMSSPLKPPMFSDTVGSSSGSSGHRKRTYVASFDDLNNDPYNNNNTYQIHGSGRRVTYMMSSPSKRYRSTPPPSRPVSGHLPPQPQQQLQPNSYNQRSVSYMAAPPLPQQPAFSGHAAWKDHHQLSHSSPIKPKRHQHFTTAAGPDVSLFHGARRIADVLTNVNYNAPQSDEDDDELLPTHSFRTTNISFGPPVTSAGGMPAGLASSASLSGSSFHAHRSGLQPSTPPMRPRTLASNGNGGRRKKKAANVTTEHDLMLDDESEGSHTGLGIDGIDGRDANMGTVISSEHNGNGNGNGKSGVEGADLLLFLAASPSPANPGGRPLLGGSSSSRSMDPPSTPPSKYNNMALPSSMMTTPGGGSMFPQTPGQAFDFADFVNITPSPAQKPWKTPNLLGSMGSKTPASVKQRRLTFDDM